MDAGHTVGAAIGQKRLLYFFYNGYLRIVEPHIHGRKNCRDGILAYQVGGGSSSGGHGWRRMYLDRISGLRMLDLTFPGKRESIGRHSYWDLVYSTVG